MSNETTESVAEPTANPSAAPTLQEQLQAAMTERDQYKEKWTRALADLDNFRKRVYREMDDERKYQCVPLLKSLLPVFDGLDRAVFAASQSKNFDDLLNGVQMTIKQLEAALTPHGAKAIAAVGKPFDPNQHEAISQAPSTEHPPMTVLHDVERGYVVHDRVIRPSKVIVASQPAQ